MSKNFKIKKSGKYFESEYLRYEAPTPRIKFHTSRTLLHNTKNEVKKYMAYVLAMEPIVELKMKEMGVNFDVKKLVSMSLEFIDNCVSGLDIRSELGIYGQAEIIINSYKKKHDKALEECQKTLNSLKENPVEYILNWREFDKYNENNDLYELGLESLDDYYADCSLKKAKKASEDLLKYLKELNNGED